MIAHGLGVIIVDPKAAGAKWTCACGACGFCYPEGPYDHDSDSQALSLWIGAQEAHRRHVATVTDRTGPSCHFRPRWLRYCRTWP